MNVKAIYSSGIESFDTRAGIDAHWTKGLLQIQRVDPLDRDSRERDAIRDLVERYAEELGACEAYELVLWANLMPAVDKPQVEEGQPVRVIDCVILPSSRFGALPDLGTFLAAAGEQAGLLRFDVDGETLWQAEPGTAGEDWDGPK